MRQPADSALGLRGAMLNFWLGGEGQTESSEDLRLLFVRARERNVALAVAVGAVEIGQASERR